MHELGRPSSAPPPPGPRTVSTTGSFQHLRLPCIALSRRRVLDRPQVRVPLFITCRYLYRSSPRSSQLVTWRTKWRRQTLEWQLHRRPVKTLDWLWLRVKRLPSNSSIPHARVESSLAPQTLPKHSGSRTACELFSNFPLSRVTLRLLGESTISSRRPSIQSQLS